MSKKMSRAELIEACKANKTADGEYKVIGENTVSESALEIIVDCLMDGADEIDTDLLSSDPEEMIKRSVIAVAKIYEKELISQDKYNTIMADINNMAADLSVTVTREELTKRMYESVIDGEYMVLTDVGISLDAALRTIDIIMDGSDEVIIFESEKYLAELAIKVCDTIYNEGLIPKEKYDAIMDEINKLKAESGLE